VQKTRHIVGGKHLKSKVRFGAALSGRDIKAREDYPLPVNPAPYALKRRSKVIRFRPAAAVPSRRNFLDNPNFTGYRRDYVARLPLWSNIH
jgi:hypothetical protein